MVLPAADWIFFFSPSGIDLFCRAFDLGSLKIAVVGQGTAARLMGLGFTADFIPGSKDPAIAVKEFAERLAPGEIVISASSDKGLNRLDGVIAESQLIEWPFYVNEPQPTFPKTKAEFLIFTSPSNAVAYLSANDKAADQKLIALGRSTAEKLEELGYYDLRAAAEPSEKGVWECVLGDWD